MKNTALLSADFTHTAAPVTAPKSGPRIYYVLNGDDPTRGDSHGYAGIGRAMAEKLGGRFFQIDDETLADLYPGTSHAYDREQLFLQEHGPADIVLCRSIRSTGCFIDRNTIVIEGRNENIGTERDKDMLVAHHITPALLADEGRTFRNHYQDRLQGTLIALLLVENIACPRLLGQALVRQALQNDQATIFLTTCWRTTETDYHQVMEGCRTAIEAAHAQDRVTLLDYHLNAERKNEHATAQSYNPYTGLLDQADHIILWGTSLSMFSEAVATGKTIHVSCIGHDNGGFKHLESKGVVRGFDFETPALETRQGLPIDKTGEIAEKLIKNNAYSLRKKSMLPLAFDDYARYEAEQAQRKNTPASP